MYTDYPMQGVFGYKSLFWAMNNFVQAHHEFDSLPPGCDQAIEKYMDAVDAAMYVAQQLNVQLGAQHLK